MSSPTESSFIILITGANQGIGYETARALLALSTLEKPVVVLLSGRDLKKAEEAVQTLKADDRELEKQHKGDVVPVQIDVTDDSSIEKAVKWIESEYGRLNILINNAGISGARGFDHLTPRQLWHAVYDTNVFGPALLTEACIPLLLKSCSSGSHDFSPRVINVSSGFGSLAYQMRTSQDGCTPQYNTSKTALNALTVYQHKEHHPPITVHAVCPGYNSTTLTGMPEDAPKPSAKESGKKEIIRLVMMNDGETKSGSYTNQRGKLDW